MKNRPRAVRETAPVQVYLDPDDQDRLERLAAQLELSKSDILRRGLDALERAVTDPATHPALRVIGLGEERKGTRRVDAARRHDQVLADDEEKSWSGRAR